MNINLLVWMNFPSHHQSQFFDALNQHCSEFYVYYYGGGVSSNRLKMGWDNQHHLKSYEKYIDLYNFEIDVEALKNFIHILPGYGHPLLLKLRETFSKNNIQWVHWSEKSTPGWKWYLSYLRKLKHAYYVNKYALGALAISSQAQNDFIRWGITQNKIVILPYSINSIADADADAEILKFKSNRKAFLYVGSLYQGKGVDLLLQSFADQFKNDENWCLILVGNEITGFNYKQQAQNLRIENQVFFRGVIPANEISSAYKATDVFILPSRYDGWGMVVNEALYSCKPIIVSNAVGSSDHLVIQDRNGFIFKNGCVKDLGYYMAQYKDVKMIERHQHYSSELFHQFDSETMAKHLISVLKKWVKYEDIS